MQKRELSEEEREVLDGVLKTIRKKDAVLAEFFRDGEYTEIMSMVSGIDTIARILDVVHTQIPFDVITKLELKSQETRKGQ